MKRLSIFALSWVCVMLSQEVLAKVIWHYPPDDRVIVGGMGMLHLVLELQGGDPQAVEISLNDLTVPNEVQPAIAHGSAFLHFFVQLEPGLNQLKASWQGGEEAREVFHLISWGPESNVPDGFVPLVFHGQAESERECTGCHDLQAKPDDQKPPSPRDSTCYSCHFRITAFKSVHGPASQWACTICHDPVSAPVRYATPQPNENKLCFRCHADLKKYIDAGPYQHGPVATGRCTICHDPHASDNLFQLKRPSWYLCTNCHTANASGQHVLNWGPSGDTHPTRGRPDPIHPHRELSCNSCHNPHAAPSPFLWQFKATNYLQLCISCHKM